MKTKTQAMASIHAVTKRVAGRDYKTFVCYLGTDPRTHRKIQFQKGSRIECENAIREFFDLVASGFGASDARDFSPEELAEARLAKKILADAGFPDITLPEAARAYCKAEGIIHHTTLADALQQYLDTFAEIQERHKESISSRVGTAVAALGADRRVADVSAGEITDYLARRYANKSVKTYNNNMLYLKSFFRWCASKPQTFCASSPMEGMGAKPIPHKDPEFCTAQTVRRIFELTTTHHDPDTRNQWICQLALSFFAGVRTAEIMRARVCDLDLDAGELRIARPKGFQHGVTPRMVELTPTALAWLRAFPPPAGQDPDDELLPKARDTDGVLSFVRDRADAAGESLDIPNNAGRHSFITMHVALHKDPRRTEAVVGTSKTMRERNYMGLASKAQAEEYFAVMPPNTATNNETTEVK